MAIKVQNLRYNDLTDMRYGEDRKTKKSQRRRRWRRSQIRGDRGIEI